MSVAESTGLADRNTMELTNGHKIAVIGGGPAGSFTAYHLLNLSQRIGLHIEVDIYEPKQFTLPGASGCNHCGGVISETLVQMLAMEGITLPPGVIMSTISSYTLHTESGFVRVGTILQEMRIATVFRGGGPKPPTLQDISSFDDFLLQKACALGARHLPERVMEIRRDGDRPQVIGKSGRTMTYDFLVGATGIAGSATIPFEKMAIGYRPPPREASYICEFFLGSEAVETCIGHDMHIFFLNMPGITRCSSFFPLDRFFARQAAFL
ncbi:MAG: hypothetical protein HQL87_10595 [Magnetococcales bacterium]|nr:hypothetical protein [Magnetococcales bacterium]